MPIYSRGGSHAYRWVSNMLRDEAIALVQETSRKRLELGPPEPENGKTQLELADAGMVGVWERMEN